MPEYLRVRDEDTGHELSIIASTVKSGNYKVLDSDAVNRNGDPLPPKYAQKSTKSLSSNTTDGQKATNQKES